jgi:hypothetical protein
MFLFIIETVINIILYFYIFFGTVLFISKIFIDSLNSFICSSNSEIISFCFSISDCNLCFSSFNPFIISVIGCPSAI